MAKLLLNVASVGTTPDAKAMVGTQPYEADTLRALRAQHASRYLVKRGGKDGDEILTVALAPGLAPIGDASSEQDLLTAHWLLGPLVAEALVRFFTSIGRPILRWRPLRVVSQQPGNIFPAEARLPDWLQRRLVLNFETRTIHRADAAPIVVLACGVNTRNVIDVSCRG